MKAFETPVVEVVMFSVEDVIATSVDPETTEPTLGPNDTEIL